MLREKLLAHLARWTESGRFQYLSHLRRCCEFLGVNGIEGDLLEFGVSRGNSLLLLENVADEILHRTWGLDYRIIGFDSFQGLPPADGIDQELHQDAGSKGLRLERGKYSASKQEVLDRISREARRPQSIELVEGWFEETLTPERRTELGIEQAVLVTIDTDLYQATRLALDWVEPLMGEVTIVALDDWYLYKGKPSLGQQRAWYEFLDSHPELTASEFFGYAWHAKAFLLHR